MSKFCINCKWMHYSQPKDIGPDKRYMFCEHPDVATITEEGLCMLSGELIPRKIYRQPCNIARTHALLCCTEGIYYEEATHD